MRGGLATRHGVAALAALVGVPLGALALAVRPAWREGLGERLGAAPAQAPGALWLHGASVGESRLVDAVASVLAARGHRLFATLQTTSGCALLRRAQPALPVGLAPLDHPWCVDGALARVAPSALVLFETELWPVWIAAAARSGVPIVLVSGRISDRAWPRYRRVARFMRGTLGRLAAVGARSERDAERLAALGAAPERLRVTGDLKWAVAADPGPVADDLRAALAGRPVMVAGSTHPGEELVALEALREAERAGHAPHLVVAPRHPTRAAAVEHALRAEGRVVRRRSRLGATPLAAGEVLVLDTLGELHGVYALAALAFVGGTLADLGGHDPLEAARAGVPVAVGPGCANVRYTVERLVAAGRATVVADGPALGRVLVAALEAPPGDRQAAMAGLRGEGERVMAATVALVEEVVGRAGP